EDERTCAVVRCQRTNWVQNGQTLRAGLIRAVTRWMKRTSVGKTALECSAGYFNIGDLVNELLEPALERFMEAEGVKGLEVEVYSGDETRWDYDDLLFDDRGLLPTGESESRSHARHETDNRPEREQPDEETAV